MIPLSIAPDLMEEAVLLAERRAERDRARAFRRERDRAYEVADPEAREALFRTLARRWFERFGLQSSVESALNEYPELSRRVSDGRIVRAISCSEEGADLLDAAARGRDDQGPRLVLRLRPESFMEPETLQALLRHELMHVADMLDPAFGYERALPPSNDGPSADNILRDRYRVVWDASIDGRLARAEHATACTRDARCCEFRGAFPALGDDWLRAFERWWNEPRPTHADLLAFARTSAADGGALAARRCPICRFPVASLDRRSSALSSAAIDAIQADHPNWHPELGLCPQCLDLYEARSGPTSDRSFPAPGGRNSEATNPRRTCRRGQPETQATNSRSARVFRGRGDRSKGTRPSRCERDFLFPTGS